MVRRFGLALSLLAAISLLPLATADAGSRRDGHRIQKHQGWKMVGGKTRHDRFHRRVNRQVVIVNVNGSSYKHRFRRHRRDINTYAGVDVYSIPGVGTYSYGVSSSESAVTTVRIPSAKIIDVSKLKPNSACEMQAGVCVIKP